MDPALKFINEAIENESNSGWLPTDRHFPFLGIGTPQAKGKIGTQLFAHYLQTVHPDCEWEIIESDESSGDLKYKYRQSSSHKWTIVEVKLSKCTVGILKSGFKTLKLWFNQIRPAKQWDEIVLVGIFPNHYRIWRKTRAEWNEQCDRLASCSDKGHTGTNDLWKVVLLRNSQTDNFHEWDEVYSNQEGDII
jgi:hypothetical protein